MLLTQSQVSVAISSTIGMHLSILTPDINDMVDNVFTD